MELGGCQGKYGMSGYPPILMEGGGDCHRWWRRWPTMATASHPSNSWLSSIPHTWLNSKWRRRQNMTHSPCAILLEQKKYTCLVIVVGVLKTWCGNVNLLLVLQPGWQKPWRSLGWPGGNSLCTCKRCTLTPRGAVSIQFGCENGIYAGTLGKWGISWYCMI